MRFKINFIAFILFVGLILFIESCAKYNEITDKKSAEYLSAKDELQETLSDTTLHNYVDKNRIMISDKNMAINIAEPLLFDIYGKRNIKNQRPYIICNVDNYWVIYGTMKYQKGGTFLIIIDSRDCRIVRITHGK